jgi:hypothetical protein
VVALDVVVVGVVEVVLVELEVGVEEVVEEVVGELDVVVVLALVVLEVERQSLAASSRTVLAPCSRLLRSVALTDGGRFLTSSLKPETALAAAGQRLALTAEETASSLLLSCDA